MKTKWIIYAVIALVVVGFNLCSREEPSSTTVTEEVVVPTQGVITTVKEVETDQYKIEDEQTVESPSDSRIIAKYMDNTIDTFTLEEARLVQDSTSTQQNQRRSSVMRMASYGLMGYMLGRSMGSFRPSSSAYIDQNTYNRVNNNAAQRMQQTARRTTVTRPSSGKSGYGGGSRSTRSYGG
jgi:hypothetical protein